MANLFILTMLSLCLFGASNYLFASQVLLSQTCIHRLLCATFYGALTPFLVHPFLNSTCMHSFILIVITIDHFHHPEKSISIPITQEEAARKTMSVRMIVIYSALSCNHLILQVTTDSSCQYEQYFYKPTDYSNLKIPRIFDFATFIPLTHPTSTQPSVSHYVLLINHHSFRVHKCHLLSMVPL